MDSAFFKCITTVSLTKSLMKSFTARFFQTCPALITGVFFIHPLTLVLPASLALSSKIKLRTLLGAGIWPAQNQTSNHFHCVHELVFILVPLLKNTRNTTCFLISLLSLENSI